MNDSSFQTKEKLSILFAGVEDDPGGGGMGRFARGLAEGLTQIDWPVTLLLPEGAGKKTSIPEERFELPRGTLNRIKAFRDAVLAFCARRPERVGYVLCNSWSPAAAGALWAVRRIEKREGRRIPYGIILHGNDILEPARSWYWRRIMRYVLERADHLFVNSKFTARRLGELGIHAQRLVIAAPGVRDLERLTQLSCKKKRDLSIISVCRLIKRKGVDQVLRVLPSLIERHPNLIYQVVGDGPERFFLEELSEELGIASHVRFYGQINDEELYGLYASSDLFVMVPYERPEEGDVEGYGIVYREAGAAGLPVIGSRTGGVPDAVDEGETGLLVAPNAPRELEAAMDRLLGDAELRRRMGETGRARVISRHAWRHTAEKVALALLHFDNKEEEFNS